MGRLNHSTQSETLGNHRHRNDNEMGNELTMEVLLEFFLLSGFTIMLPSRDYINFHRAVGEKT